MASTLATFSYAQAAKGQAMSRSVSQEESNTSKPTSEGASEHEITQQEEISKPATVTETSTDSVQTVSETMVEQHKAAVDDVSPENVIEISKALPVKDEKSRASSPSASSNAATKSVREDDVSATPAESESTWEKASQGSQVDQLTEKSGSNGDEKKLSTYEQIKPQMKEAPVPVVNIWQKRMEDAQAKAGPAPVSIVAKSERSVTQLNGDASYKRPASKSLTSNTQSNSTELKNQQRLTKPTTAANPSANAQPPPTADSSSWPTPEVANSEERKAGNERSEQLEKLPVKPHGKEKWEKVAFVPTAVFSTPLPIRGGARGGRTGSRGGRESFAAANGVFSSNAAGDHSHDNNDTKHHNTTNQFTDRTKSRDLNGAGNAIGLNSKRASSIGATSNKEGGLVGEGAYEKRESFNQRSGNIPRSNDARHHSTSIQTNGITNNGQSGVFDAQKRGSISSEANGEPRFPRSDRTYQPRVRESGSEQNGYLPSRERGEGRSDRGGRGGWRGKSATQNHGTYGTGSHYQQPSTNGKSYSEQRHNSHPTSFSGAREPRHSRTNSRSQSIPNGQMHPRFGPPHIGSNGLPVLQTDVANAMPYVQQPAIMSAIPYHPYMEQVHVPAMLQMQLEYYFSVDNLCKDMFLRKNMDSQGFVFIHVLANFNRVQTLTTNTHMIKWVCGHSSVIELRTTHDGFDLVRKAVEWKNWVLPVEDRDPSAQSEGPSQLFSPRFESFPPPFTGFEALPHMAQNIPMRQGNPFVMNGFRGEIFPAKMNGRRQGQFSQGSVAQIPLSADVPEFQPSQSIAYQEARFQGALEPEQKFSDSAIESIQIFIKSAGTETSSKHSHALESHTNGVKDHVEDDNDSGAVKVNGISLDESHVNGVAQQNEDLSKSTIGRSDSESSSVASARSRITWTASTTDSEGGELYHVLRTRARQEHIATAAGDCSDTMKDLYEFWSLFLLENFNILLYQDFHSSALEDANTKQSLVGLGWLVEFYIKSLASDTILADRLLQDFVGLATVEFSNQYPPRDRPAYRGLRKIWGDGLISFDNRVNLSKKLHEPLKTALNEVRQSP